MKSRVLFVCTLLVHIFHISVCKPVEPISYHIEFDILEFKNEGRLSDGDCCQQPYSAQSNANHTNTCPDTLESCNTFWTLCISHLPNTEITSDSAPSAPVSLISANLIQKIDPEVPDLRHESNHVQSMFSSTNTPTFPTNLASSPENNESTVETTVTSVKPIIPNAQRGYKRNRALSLDWRFPLESRTVSRRRSPTLVRRPVEPKFTKASSFSYASSTSSKPLPKSTIKSSSIKLPPIKSSSSSSSSNHKNPNGSLVGGLTRPLAAATSSVAAAAGNALPAALSTLSATAISSAAQVSIRGIFNRLWPFVKSITSESNLIGNQSGSTQSEHDRFESSNIGFTPSDLQSSVDAFKHRSATCSLAYWKTDSIRRTISLQRPVRFRAHIPTPTMSRWMSSVSSNASSNVQERIENVTFDKHFEFEHWQPLLFSLEAWHEHDHSDRLIARMLQSANATLYLPMKTGFWQYGTWSTRAGNSSTEISISYRYRLYGNLSEEANKLFEQSVQIANLAEDTVWSSASNLSLCPKGYTGSLCKTPICRQNCSKTHGYCDKPGDCKCRFGWTGEDCSSCVPMPGCVHGTCNKPFECKCEEGWNGMFCDKPTCRIGCHPQNGFCEHPNECRCRFGFQGENCTDCAPMPGCQNGFCSKPLECQCLPGWKGVFCTIPVCSEGCHAEHGWCRRPDECRCRIGWQGANCSQCAPYPGCVHGSCINEPWTCRCDHGYGGIRCDEKLDYCETHPNPCLNSGICVSVEKAEGSFVCQCSNMYQGKFCESIKIV